MPGPGSRTIIPDVTKGWTTARGFSMSFRNGLASQKPSHQGQTRSAMDPPCSGLCRVRARVKESNPSRGVDDAACAYYFRNMKTGRDDGDERRADEKTHAAVAGDRLDADFGAIGKVAVTYR